MIQICSFRPLEVYGALSQLDLVPLRAVLMLARVKIREPADFSVASNVNFVNFLMDLGTAEAQLDLLCLRDHLHWPCSART